MAYHDIYLVVEFQGVRVPFLHVSRNPRTLDHVVMDRGRDHRVKVTYHGNGHTHLQDEDARQDCRDQMKKSPGYRGGCSSGVPVGNLAEPQYVAGFSVDLSRLFNEELYTRKSVQEYVLLVLPTSAQRLEVEVLLCPGSAEAALDRQYEVCTLYKSCEPVIAFCMHEKERRSSVYLI